MSTRSSAGMGRRAFLRVAAATATLAVEHKGSSENLGYVDAHSHLWSPERSRYPLRPGANEADVQPKGFTPGDFFAHARPEGVNRVVIIGHTAHFGSDATYLTDVLKARPGEIAAQAYLDHADPNVTTRMAELKRQGVKAFRFRLLDPWQADFPETHPIMKAYQFAAMRAPGHLPPDESRLAAPAGPPVGGAPGHHRGHRPLRAHRRRRSRKDPAGARHYQAGGRH